MIYGVLGAQVDHGEVFRRSSGSFDAHGALIGPSQGASWALSGVGCFLTPKLIVDLTQVDLGRFRCQVDHGEVFRRSSGVLGAPGALIGRSQGASRALSSVECFLTLKFIQTRNKVEQLVRLRHVTNVQQARSECLHIFSHSARLLQVLELLPSHPCSIKRQELRPPP